MEAIYILHLSRVVKPIHKNREQKHKNESVFYILKKQISIKDLIYTEEIPYNVLCSPYLNTEDRPKHTESLWPGDDNGFHH